jgi:hypothetical protein
VIKTTLKGAPSDKKLQPVMVETELGKDGLKLDAYSFTVLRFKKA